MASPLSDLMGLAPLKREFMLAERWRVADMKMFLRMRLLGLMSLRLGVLNPAEIDGMMFLSKPGVCTTEARAMEARSLSICVRKRSLAFCSRSLLLLESSERKDAESVRC